MLTDLVQIQRLGENKRKENLRFRLYLKSHNFVERRLRKIAQDVENEIDCLQCGSCCRVATATVSDRDVERLSKFLGMSFTKFIKDYTMEDENEGRILRRDDEQGCVFLSGNACTVYEARPSACQYFPHMVKGEGSVVSRMWQFVDRATYCPIVYNTLEEWKEETRFSPAPK